MSRAVCPAYSGTRASRTAAAKGTKTPDSWALPAASASIDAVLCSRGATTAVVREKAAYSCLYLLLPILIQIAAHKKEKIARNPRNHPGPRPSAPPAAPAPAPAQAAAAPAASPAPAQAAAPGTTVNAPLAGTFYSSPGAGKPPFVKVGDIVEAGATVCTVEAMKLFNEVKTAEKCKIAEILVAHGAAVQKDQPLIRFERAG